MSDVRKESFYKEHEHDYWQCPFCGRGLPTTLCLHIGTDNLYYVKCDRCGAQTGSYIKQQDATNNAKYGAMYIVGPSDEYKHCKEETKEEAEPANNTARRVPKFTPKEEE